jgi:hypothetical protein
MMRNGIFCLEAEWFNDYTRPTSIEPTLKLLASAEGWRIPYVHRHVATMEEFRYYVNLWLQARHRGYPILYLAFHGDSGSLCVGDQRRKDSRPTLGWFKSEIGSRGQGRLIYFGSCSTMDVHGNKLNGFLNATQLEAAIGYVREVDWMDSTILDLFVLSRLGRAPKLNRTRIRRIEVLVCNRLQGLYKNLKMRVVTRP